MSRSKRDSKGKVLNEDVLVEVKPLEPWPDPPPKKERAPQSDQKPKGKVLNEDFIVKVKPTKPWPDPPKSSSESDGKSTSKTTKKD